MIIVNVNDKTKKIPTHYKDMTVKKFQSLWKILCKYDTDKLKREEGDVDVLKVVEMESQCTIEICANLLEITTDEASRIPFAKAVEVVEVFNNMMSKNFINEQTAESWSKWGFTFKGEMYYFPKINFEDMTFGEFAELQQIKEIYGKEVEQRFDFIPMQLARSCRKHNEGKDDYDLDERAKMFEEVDMETVLKWTFFLTRQADILNRSTQTSKLIEQTLLQRKSAISSQDMDG